MANAIAELCVDDLCTRSEAEMDILGSLSNFVRVAEMGSFSRVAREAGVGHTVITRQVAQLEEHFGVRLLHRTTRQLSLTNDGQVLIRHAKCIVENAAAMERELGQHRAAPMGLVRLGTPIGPSMVLGPKLPGLLQQHPGLSVELVVGEQLHDMIEARLDLALRTGRIADKTLIARRVGAVDRIVVAAPGYLRDASGPTAPADLQRHVCILHNDEADRDIWNFSGPDGAGSVRVTGPISTNSELTALLMVRAGCGIACLPHVMVSNDIRTGRLIRLLPEHEPEPATIHVAYPSRRHLALKTRVLLDFVVQVVRVAMDSVRLETQPPRISP